MALRLVSRNTKRIAIGEEDFIEVREDISRREFNKLLSTLVSRGAIDAEHIDMETATAFSDALFSAFVVDWSVVDEKGKSVECTLENYGMLSRDASVLVEQAITAHFQSLTPDNEEATKSEEPSEE